MKPPTAIVKNRWPRQSAVTASTNHSRDIRPKYPDMHVETGLPLAALPPATRRRFCLAAAATQYFPRYRRCFSSLTPLYLCESVSICGKTSSSGLAAGALVDLNRYFVL
jgi:hypothetical protein